MTTIERLKIAIEEVTKIRTGEDIVWEERVTEGAVALGYKCTGDYQVQGALVESVDVVPTEAELDVARAKVLRALLKDTAVGVK